MAVTLEKLYLSGKQTYQMDLLAGKAGLHHYVRWVHIIENLQAPSFLHGGELVFTTGIGQRDSRDWLLHFAEKIYESGGAGLVVNIGPYIDTVSSKVIIFCEQHGLPLFQVPWKVHIIDITYDFCHHIVENEENETSLANALRDLIFSTKALAVLRPMLERHGFFDTGTYCTAAFHLECSAGLGEEQRGMLLFRAHRLLGHLGCQYSLFYQDGRLIAVTNGLQPDQVQLFAENFASDCAARNPAVTVFAGIGSQADSCENLPVVYREALSALKMALCRHQKCLHYRNLGVYKLLLAVKDPSVLRQMYEEVLGPLERFDEKHHTDYLQTLQEYIEHNSSIQELAQLSGLHRNTVNYRIQRIKNLLNCSLTEEDKLKFLLAFYIRNLLS